MYWLKGLIGAELKLFPFRIASDSESVIKLDLGGRTFTPPEISAQVLRQLKDNDEAALGQKIKEISKGRTLSESRSSLGQRMDQERLPPLVFALHEQDL